MMRTWMMTTMLVCAVTLGTGGCPEGSPALGGLGLNLDPNGFFGFSVDPNDGWDPFDDPNFWVVPSDPNELDEPTEPDGGSDAGATKLFDQVWRDFDETYSYFTHKDVDWDAIKTRFRGDFEADLSADQFAEKLAAVLRELRDLHIHVQKPDGTNVDVYSREITRNFSSTPRNRYRTSEYQTLGSDLLWHAWFENNIAYIRVDSFEVEKFAAISDQQIEDIFATYAGAAGMIFDIRANNGGDDRNAANFVSRFTDQVRTYGYTQTRDGAGHDDFGALEARTLDPSSGTRFIKPVACLIGERTMSSGEWATQMAKVCPNVTLIGDTTRGSSGDPKGFSLPNGVIYTVPTWIAYTDQQVKIEDRGIDPDIAIDPEQSVDSSHDYVLERAIQELTK